MGEMNGKKITECDAALNGIEGSDQQQQQERQCKMNGKMDDSICTDYEEDESDTPEVAHDHREPVKKMQVRTIQVDEAELLRLVRDEAMALPDMNIAISGMAGRFPKSDSVNEFEEHLREGRDMINDNDNSRFTCGLWNLPPRAGRLKDLSRFDHDFFGFSLDHANYIDFQLRILYEVVYESILDAGLNPAELRGTNTGVFFGLHCNEFENAMADDPGFKTNGYYAQFAIKVAQYFDLRGITLTFDAACASGFVGLHNAVEALRDGVIDQAIVCSSNIPVHPTGSFIFYQMQMLSPTGYSRFLDSRADGYVKSEACVSMLLQRKHLAKRNWATIMATMTSVDGYKPEGITFPSDKSQERLMRQTKELVGLSVNHVEYLEAHGTGTPAGDPQEARAISNVYFPKEEEEGVDKEAIGEPREKRRIGPLLVGSVKTCMGHSEAASGLCALAKAALMLEHELIYKNLHFNQPNTNIEALMDGRLKFVDRLKPLKSKIIPLSCYGFGGANVHAIVRANERQTIGSLESSSGSGNKLRLMTGGLPRLVVMFGRSEQQLNDLFDQLTRGDTYNTQYCATDDFLSLLDSINSGKIDRLMNHRGFILLDDAERHCELYRSVKACELRALSEEQRLGDDIGRRPHHQEHVVRPVQLLLPGLGCEWAGMASGLREFGPFWDTIERLSDILSPCDSLGMRLADLLQNGHESQTQFGTSLTRTFVAIVAYQVALVNLIQRHLRVNNLGAIVGHSLGEISCAYACGLFDEREAIMVAYQLGRTLDENKTLIAGKMVALLGAPQETLVGLVDIYQKQFTDTSVATSCINGSDSVTISGKSLEVDQFLSWMMEQHAEVANQLIIHEVSRSAALHNDRLMKRADMGAKLREALGRVLLPLTDYDRTKTAWLSSFLNGDEKQEGELAKQANVEYFVEMLCRRVDLHQALKRLPSGSIIYELAPSCLFKSQIIQIVDESGERKFEHVSSMLKSATPEEQPARLLTSFGELYQAGATFDLRNFYESASGRKFEFPVRRQTPSLSSLIGWDHSSSLFVPRYPIQFSKSSAKCEMPIDMVQDRDKYLAGHCIEGRVLHPATGYLFLIWRIFSFTKRKIYDACFHDVESELVPIEFRNVRLMRAVILGQRQVQMYVHYEEASGRFEIKEGGSVVCEGFALTPVENPHGLLYEGVRRRIEQDSSVEMSMKKDDVYKQFRVCGYDYGETFQCIEEASADGQMCRVKFNGHFISLTDSILQSIFLAIAQHAPAGALFLPTRFEYVRFQPEIILAKVRAANMPLDQSDGSLNTKAKREMMNQIMQRESDAGKIKPESPVQADSAASDLSSSETDSALAEGRRTEESEEKLECIFDTFCDPRLNIIVTDGIEMRGVKASPAPRRMDNNEVLLESYQFVRDIEMPVRDDKLTALDDERKRNYLQALNSMSLDLLVNLLELRSHEQLNGLLESHKFAPLARRDVESYLKEHLECLYDKAAEATNMAVSATSQETNGGAATRKTEKQLYDIRKNGARALMSICDQLLALSRQRKLTLQNIRERIQENRTHLMRDLLQQSYISERFIRPLIETVIENVCTKKTKLRMVEINTDDGILRPNLQQFIQQIEPNLQLDYALAHPDPNRLHGAAIASAPGNNNSAQVNKTHTLKSVEGLVQDSQLRDLDLIVYKDKSCYSLMAADSAAITEATDESTKMESTLKALTQSVKPGGYFIMLLRQQMTLAERILAALNEQAQSESAPASPQLIERIEAIGRELDARCALLVAKAAQMDQICLVSQKSDDNGCLMLLFRRFEYSPASATSSKSDQASQLSGLSERSVERPPERLILRVRHDDLSWLEMLKANFKQADETNASELSSSHSELDDGRSTLSDLSSAATSSSLAATRAPRQVWLCAVLTREQPVSGLVGMMQALRKELGSTHLRCYYDAHTFRHHSEPLSTRQIVDSAHFQEALRRDQIWNCVEGETGQFGSFRHFTINEQLAFDDCLCGKQKQQLQSREASAEATSGRKQRGAYVNTATRGDLSSFTWFEAPFEYLDEQSERTGELVRVAYSALNFRDIMLATGRLPLDALPMRLALADCLLGLEFSGIDSEGKRVMGIVYGRGIGTHVWCPRDTAVKLEIPDGMSLAEAATIPIVYTTAIMALVYRGQMKRGESVLIHAGSGGVGQAAIRLALHWGLEVFTTVGTDEKRAFLLEEFAGQLKPENVFNSRSCEFEQQIFWATRGRGVDLVLNSLAEEKLQASLNCLADGGRFLEIGKYDLSVDTQMELLKLDTNKTFHGILLDKLFDADEMTEAFKEQLELVLETMRQGAREGFVKPIKFQCFKHNEVEEAFRFMATGKHIGKVLIEIGPELDSRSPVNSELSLKCVPRFQMSQRKSFIVTGGLGGFGLELCKWLADHGMRHLVLTSRSGVKTGYQKAVLRRLEARDGVKVRVVTEGEADAGTLEGSLRLCEIAREMSPSRQLGGIFHLAMVLKDTLLENMSADDFRLVCRPKLAACLALDEASSTIERQQEQPLDFFVAFSSVTSGKGNAGQSNYAYANSCLERVCERRRARGAHGLAIQWGAIGDVGVAFENLGGNDVIIGGTVPQRMPSCLATLGKLLCSPYAVCLSVLPVSRQQDGLNERGDLVGAIMHVLGIKDPSKVSEEATLGELGLDSLMAVEIRQYIEREYEMTLNIQEIRALTIAKIREIGESEKPKAAAAEKAKAVEEKKKKEVTSYGQTSRSQSSPEKAASQQVAQDEARAARPIELPDEERVPSDSNQVAVEAKKMISEKFQAKQAKKSATRRKSSGSRLTEDSLRKQRAVLDKSLVSTFVPALELPQADWCLLNEPDFSSPLARRPLFFVPPIHGQFELLKPVCAHIARPCVGLNWTSKLGKAQTVDESAQVYLRLLHSLDWSEFTLSPDERIKQKFRTRSLKAAAAEPKVIDLVGYSFGATVAYELMRAIWTQANTSDTKWRNQLAPGRLVLLDGAPKQIELGSRYLAGLTRRKPLELNEKVDELLMVYLIANTRSLAAPGEYLAVQRQLSSLSEPQAKVELASAKLVEFLRERAMLKRNKAQVQRECETMTPNELAAGKAARKRARKFLAAHTKPEVRLAVVGEAIEAYLRRYEMVSLYKVGPGKLRSSGSVTLVRAEQVYLKNSATKDSRRRRRSSQTNGGAEAAANGSDKSAFAIGYNDDLGLSTLIEGQVELHVLAGDHESFLLDNAEQIGAIIMRATAPPELHIGAESTLLDGTTVLDGRRSANGGPDSPDSLLEGAEPELGA